MTVERTSPARTSENAEHVDVLIVGAGISGVALSPDMRRTSQNRREWTQNGVYENIPAFVFQRRGYSARFPRSNAERCGGSRVRTEGAKKSYSWEELNRSKKIEYTYSSNPPVHVWR